MFLRVAAESLNVDAPKGVLIGSSLPVSLSNSGAPFLFVIWADFTPFELHKMSPISISLNCAVVMAVYYTKDLAGRRTNALDGGMGHFVPCLCRID